MVVPVSGGNPVRGSGPGGASGESQKPKIISELMKRSVGGAGETSSTPARGGRPAGRRALDFPSSVGSLERGDRPRICGVLHCARSEWSPRWEPRYLRVNHGSLEVYLTEEGGGGPASGARPRRRLPLRNLSLRRVPRRQHAFSICPRDVNASPLLLCQADNAESFSRWTRTLAVELMKQTPLGEVRFLDILRITESPHPDNVDELHGCDPQQPMDEHFSNEVEQLKELCQRGGASVHERRRLFEALGGTGGGSTSEPRKKLSLSRSCASSEDLGQQPGFKSVLRSRAKRAKSLHDLPSDFPVPCSPEGGPPISVVSQLRLFFERIGQNGSEPREEGKNSDCRAEHSSMGHVAWSSGVKGQPKKTVRSQSYTCESTQNLAESCDASCENDNVFLNANQKLDLEKGVLQGGRGRKDLAVFSSPCQDVLNMTSIDNVKKDVNMNSYSKQNLFNGIHVKADTVIMTENIPLAANVMARNNSQPSSLSHSLSSESLTSSFLPSVPSPSSSCSSLSLNLSTPSSSPNSQLSHHHYILSVIKKQAADAEENIWSLQEEMARLDRKRIAAQNNQAKMTRKPSTPKRTYCEIEAQLQQEELKLDKLYKEAERVLKSIERSVKQDAVLASMNPYQTDKKWCELHNSQKFNLRSLTS